MADVFVDLAAWCFVRLKPKPFLQARWCVGKALKEWGVAMLRKRVTPLQVALGLLAVSVMGEMTDAASRAGRAVAAGLGAAPPQWDEYYRDGALPFRELFAQVWPGGPLETWDANDDAAVPMGMHAALVLLRRAKRGDPAAVRWLEQFRYEQDGWLSRCLECALGINSDGDAVSVSSPAWRFLLQVFVPCLQKHGRRPDQLFADFAERGDSTALQQLLALDPSLRNHPDIRDRIAVGLAGGDAALRKATGRVRLRSPTERQVHATLLVSLLLKQFSQLWTAVTAPLRQSVDRRTVGTGVWGVLTQKTLNATDIRNLLFAYDRDPPRAGWRRSTIRSWKRLPGIVGWTGSARPNARWTSAT